MTSGGKVQIWGVVSMEISSTMDVVLTTADLYT